MPRCIHQLQYYRLILRENGSICVRGLTNDFFSHLQLHATDKDDGSYGEIKYFIKSDKDELFTLDPNSGILYPKRSLNGLKGEFSV